MKKKETSYEDLIEEALANAKSDRDRAVEAFDKVKEVYNIDFDNAESMQGLMLLGQSVPKLLELANKSNEQIIKLAHLREKENSRTKSETKDSGPINIEDVRRQFREQAKN